MGVDRGREKISKSNTTCRDDLRKAQRCVFEKQLDTLRRDSGLCVKSMCRHVVRTVTVSCESVATRGLAALGARNVTVAMILVDLESWKSRKRHPSDTATSRFGLSPAVAIYELART